MYEKMKTKFEKILAALQLVREREQEVLWELLSLISRFEGDTVCIHYDANGLHFSPVLQDGTVGYASTKDNNCLCESIVRCLWQGVPRTESSFLSQTDEDARELATSLRQFLYLKPDLSGWREDLGSGDVEEEGRMLGVSAFCHLQKVIEAIRGLPLTEGWFLRMNGRNYCRFEYSQGSFAQEELWDAAKERQRRVREDAAFASFLVEDGEEYVWVEQPQERSLGDVLAEYEWVELSTHS